MQNKERIYPIAQLIEAAGNAHSYQARFNLLSLLQWMFAAFIQMGFPVLFMVPAFICQPENAVCPTAQACAQDYVLDPSTRSVVYQFGMVCEQERVMSVCLDAFLYGGFIGCFWYGQVIERKGRAYALKESMAVMVLGIIVAWAAGSVTVLGIGFFFINFGFRGYANASVNMMVEITSDLYRQISPILFSIGWALGQIFMGAISYLVVSWRFTLVIAGLPLLVLWYLNLSIVESPRFLVVKREYQAAREALASIAAANERSLKDYEIEEEVRIQNKIKNLEVAADIKISTQTRHFSYFSIFRYPSVRIRTVAFSVIWAVFSLSYFQSASGKVVKERSVVFNLCLSGAIEIVGCLLAGQYIFTERRVETMRRLVTAAAMVHLLFYFQNPAVSNIGFWEKLFSILGDLAIRVLTSLANGFMLVYVTQAFPTIIRHYELGFITFASKLAYVVQPALSRFWRRREINPYMVNGFLFLMVLPLLAKLRETKDQPLKDFIEEDEDGFITGSLTVGLL